MRNPIIPGFKISRISWRDLALTLGPFVLLVIVAVWITLHFVQPAPPDTIIMTSGAEGSMFELYAGRYAKILARQGVKLKILPSQGSLENLKRLSDAQFNVNVGFVQGGIASLGNAIYTTVSRLVIRSKSELSTRLTTEPMTWPGAKVSWLESTPIA